MLMIANTALARRDSDRTTAISSANVRAGTGAGGTVAPEVRRAR
jgi:hypothetical protein